MQKQTTKTAKATAEKVAIVRLEDKIYQAVEQMQAKDENIRVQNVTGYVGIKYGNKILLEFHDKKKAISHLTFSQKQKVFKTLQDKKLIQRVVPASYGWKYDTECLLTEALAKAFPELLASVVAEAVEERNLRKKDKKEDKKVAKA